MNCPHCQREAAACACTQPLLPPVPAWRYELQQRVDAYRSRRQRPAPPRVLPFRSTAASRPAEALAEPVVMRARPLLAAPVPEPPPPAPVWESAPALVTDCSAVRVPLAPPETALAEALAPAARPRPQRSMEVVWPAASADRATFLQLPLPMWAPAPTPAPAASCPVAPLELRRRAATADAAVVGGATALFALTCWASLGAPALAWGGWRHWLPALAAVPGLLAAVYLLACAALGGATLGMRWNGLHVVDWQGQPADGAQWRRGWASVISLAALGLGFLWVVCDSQQLTWHDYISRTCVADATRPPPAPAPEAQA